MKKLTLFLVAMTMSLFSFAQTQMSGTYTVGTGGTYDYASMADAGMAIKSATFTGNVTLLICTDLTETINTGIINKSEYTLTIRPDKDENRTITYTTATDNTGPTGVFVIGGDMTKTPGSTIGWASVPTKNVVLDGAAEGKTTPRLTITNEKWGTNVLLYGNVQDVVIKNCILTGKSSNTAYALVFRSENYSQTSKDIAPKNCLVENCILQSSSASSQTVYFQGNQANSVAGWPANITIRNSSIRARTRGLYVRQVNNLTIEGCTFDMSNSTSGILAQAIMGEGARGTINVKGNKFIKNSTANIYGGAFGLQTITASGGADVWVIENNYFAGYDALKAISNTEKGTEARLVAVRCGDYCEVRHNTFHMPNLTKDQASKLVSASPTTLLWLAGSHQYPVQNNIFVCEETTANVSLIRGGLNENVTGNVFYHKGGNAAIVAAAPSCMIFADLETSYPTQAAISKWTNVTFADAANGDLSLAGSSDGDANLAVDRLAEVPTDINGTTRREKTYAGAYEGSEFPAEVCKVNVTITPVGSGTVEGAGECAKGSSITLTATPAAHYDFESWTGDITSTDNPLIITVNSDLNITANFQEHDKYTITAHAADNTMGYVTGSGTYYVGETVTLKAVANGTYYFVNWSDGNTDAIRTFTATADVALTANFAKASPRAWAYDLKMVEEGDNYKLSFTATTAANATLLFLDKEGNELYPAHDIGAVAAGANTVSIEKSYFTQVKDVYWSVKMDGEAITAVAEITDQSRGIYDFYNMMGVALDNNPNSKDFAKIYIQQAYEYPGSGNTAERNKTQKAGIFIYDQGLNELNTPANVGIQPQLPYTLGGDRQNFKRMTINPANGHIAFCNNKTDNGGAYSVSRADLTSEAINLTKDIADIKNVNALCFDKDGNLYVVANVVTNYTNGDIYKIKDDGTYTKLTPLRPDGKKIWVDEEIAIVSDGRGGIWVAQKRDGITQYSALFHVNFKQSKVDFVLEKNQAYSDWFIGTNRRGAIAYDVQRDILAVHGPNVASLFSVAYDGEGVPTITKLLQTPNIGSSNIDGLAFDYAGDLYLVSSGTEKFYKYTLPTDENICTVPAPASQAIIKEIKYAVTVNTIGNGTVTGAGNYTEGETATLTASPTAHHQFVNWTFEDESTSTENPLTLVVNSDITVTANFEPVQYTITASTNDENKGMVSGAGTYSYGAEVTLTATPADGYKLLYWSDRSTDNPRTITMTKNEAISAYFVKDYAVEPTFTIEKVWENTDVPTSTNNGFQAVGWNHKIYMKNRLERNIREYSSATGYSVYTYTDEFNSDDAIHKGDQPIAVDDAGNIIVRSGSTIFYEAPTQITIFKKDAITPITIDLTLPATGRCDFISASGNIFSAEGGYVYFYCQYQTTVNRVKIAEGALVAIDQVGTGLISGQSQSHVMTNIFGNIVAHTKSSNMQEINIQTKQILSFTLPSHKNTTLGGCSFELGGKELWAYNVGETNYTSEWKIYNMTDKKDLFNENLYAKDKSSKNSAANWLNMQVVDENTAYIYQFCPTVAVAVWKITLNRTDLSKYTVTANANNTNMGIIVGAGEYYDGATAMLTATANAGYKFVNWTKNDVEVSTSATYLFTVTEDISLVANFEVVLRDTENNEGLLTDLDGTTTNVSVYRSLTGGMYNTLCLPFNINDLAGTPLENATVWQYKGATVKGDGTSKEIFLDFAEVDAIEAGQPYLVEPTEDIAAPMEFKNVIISVTNGSDVAQGAVTMHAILHPTELQADDKSILFLVENNNLAWANVTANMNGMRAYFKVNEPSLLSARTRAYIRREPYVATDMENITTNESEIKKVIYNGNIYIIRGEEVYTIQGTRIK